jgi:hypothetical protein
MANQFIQVPPQSTGLKVQTFENTVGGNVVESEAVTLVRSSDNTEVGTSGQPLRVDPAGTTTQPVSGTVTTTPPANASTNITQVAGTAIGATSVVNYGSTPAAVAVEAVNAFITNTPAVTLASTTVTNTVAVSGTVTTTPPSNASTNVAQFGGNAVVTGTGTGGVGIPRVTVSSDSFPATQAVSGSVSVSNFPATQPVSAVSLPLPANAAQETGGNLASIAASETLTASQTRNDAQVIDVLNAILSQLKMLNMHWANNSTPAVQALDVEILDTFPSLN